MKKNNQDTIDFKSVTDSKNNFEIDKIKTTNVNILLNRVRLDKKRTLQKRIVFSFILITIVSSIAVYFII